MTKKITKSGQGNPAPDEKPEVFQKPIVYDRTPEICTPWKRPKTKGQVFKHPSLTRQDDTLSIRQIFQRYAQGLPLDAKEGAVYEGDDNYVPVPDNWNTMDLSERADFMSRLATDIKNIKDKHEKELRQTELDALRRQFRKEYDDEKEKEVKQEAKQEPPKSSSGTL